jgi:hypothetical protein
MTREMNPQHLGHCACCDKASDQLVRYGNGRLYCGECPPLHLLGTSAQLRDRQLFTGPSIGRALVPQFSQPA